MSRYRIIGIDPGSQITGFCILEKPSNNNRNIKEMRIIDAGVLRTKAGISSYEKTGYLHKSVLSLIEKYQPDTMVIEKAFTGVNPQSALRLGETRGSYISAAFMHNLKIRELTPTHVKKAITGHGHADKDQVANAVKYLMGFEKQKLPYDVTDAIAIALSYSLLGDDDTITAPKIKKTSWTSKLKHIRG